MSEFQRVARVADLADPGKLCLELDERSIVLVRVGSEFFCLDDICTHDGGPLGEGSFCDFALACPRHGAKFDVRTGRPLTMPATEPTAAHQVRVVGDDIYVKLSS